MAHFAKLDENNLVTQVVVIANGEMLLEDNNTESETLGSARCTELYGPGPWVQTSYNSSFRHRYAGVGSTYDEVNDVFINPKPYPSWSLDSTYDWVSPVAPPSPEFTDWDEENQVWHSNTSS